MDPRSSVSALGMIAAASIENKPAQGKYVPQKGEYIKAPVSVLRPKNYAELKKKRRKMANESRRINRQKRK